MYYLIIFILKIHSHMKLPLVFFKRNLNLLNNLDNLNNIEYMNLFMNNYQKTITHSKFLKNELLFLLNKKVKVYIHIEQLFTKTNIYHIGITFKSISRNVRYDIHGFNINNLYNLLSYNLYSKTIFWDYSYKTIKEIIDYEKNLDYRYILGIYDCRHYVKNLTKWACNNPTPIWKLYKLID